MMEEEKKLTPYEADAEMRAFIERNAVASLRHREWADALKRLQEVEKASGDKMKEYAQGLADKEDAPLLKRMRELYVRMGKLQGGDSAERIKQIFLAVFKKMSSRTKEVTAKPPDSRYGWRYTIGKDGFGRRYNVQAEAIYSYDGVVGVLQKKDEILQTMKNMRGMAPWCERLKKFSDILKAPEIFQNEMAMEVKLERPVLLPTEYRATEYGVTSSDRLQFSSSSFLKLLYEKPNDYEESRRVMTSDKTVRCGFSYMQLRPHLKQLVEQLEQKLLPEIEKGENVIKELQEEFKTELTMQAL